MGRRFNKPVKSNMYMYTVYPYDVPPIVTIRVDAIKAAVVKTYDRDRAELLYMGQNNSGNFLPSLIR